MAKLAKIEIKNFFVFIREIYYLCTHNKATGCSTVG